MTNDIQAIIDRWRKATAYEWGTTMFQASRIDGAADDAIDVTIFAAPLAAYDAVRLCRQDVARLIEEVERLEHLLTEVTQQ